MNAQLILFLLATSLSALGQESQLNKPYRPQNSVGRLSDISSVEFSAIEIRDRYKNLVFKIDGKTGQVTFGEGMTPSAATLQFAEEMKRFWPSVCDGRRSAWTTLGVIF